MWPWVDDIRSPGLSQICVRHDTTIRASGIRRSYRLAFSRDRNLSMAWLVNTIAHEAMHLYSKSPEQPCLDLFIDDGKARNHVIA